MQVSFLQKISKISEEKYSLLVETKNSLVDKVTSLEKELESIRDINTSNDRQPKLQADNTVILSNKILGNKSNGNSGITKKQEKSTKESTS